MVWSIVKLFFASVTIFSVLLISTSCVSSSFQAFKIYQNQGEGLWQLYLAKSGEFFLIILLFELFLVLVILIFTKRVSPLGNGIKEIKEGSIPLALLTSCIILGFAIVFRIMASETMDYITPQYLNFR